MPIVDTSVLENLTPENNISVYNGLDCCMTLEVFNALKELPDNNSNLVYDFARAMQAPVIEMMLRGFKVNASARDKAIKLTRARMTILYDMIQQFADAVWDKGLNPNSGKQLTEILYDHLKLNPEGVFKGGEEKFPMDRKTLEKLQMQMWGRPIISPVLAWRDLARQLQLLETEVDSDWRMRTSFNIAGTTTGRWSSSKSSTGTGGNFQNVDPDLRYIFTADEGYKLYGYDLEQAESREVGLLCGLLFGEWTYLDACEGADLHTVVARLVWPHLAWNGEAKHDREIADQRYYRTMSYRDLAKRAGHGSNYLLKPKNAAEHLKIPVDLAEEFQRKYYSAFPAIPKLHQWVATQLQTKMYLINVFGRRRDFFDRPDSDDTIRKAVAFLPQSATGDRLNLGLYRIWKTMPHVELLAQVHDAVYLQAPDHIPEQLIDSQIKSCLEIPLYYGDRKFIVPSEGKVGYNWGSFDSRDPEKNPNGLRKLKF